MDSVRRSPDGLVVNLWHLKSTNGMFYYARDYVRAVGEPVLLLMHPRLARFDTTDFGATETFRVGLWGYVRFFLRLLVSRRPVFTPTPHPLPFLGRQLIVVHDSFAFRGRIGFVKRVLLSTCLATSRCKVAYINNSDALRFASRFVGPARRVFLPNHFPTSAARIEPSRRADGRISVGLIGTDSPKKNYASLFRAVADRRLEDRFHFVAFGHDTPYFREVKAAFPGIQTELVLSDTVGLQSFLSRVECVASVATNEGFGRPVASALASGIPCFLLEDEVFREFYGRSAMLLPTVDAVVTALLELRQKGAPPASLPIPQEVQSAIESGIALIKNI